MSRHLRRIERMDSARAKHEAAQLHPYMLVMQEGINRMLDALKKAGNSAEWRDPEALHRYTWAPTEPATITNLDADHAMANEREAVAQMVSRCGDAAYDSPFQSHVEAQRLWELADAIRDGDHHANTPPNAQEQG